MDSVARGATDGGIVLLLLAGVALFRSPRTARLGNGAAALALAAAIALVLLRHPVGAPTYLVLALAVGGVMAFGTGGTGSRALLLVLLALSVLLGVLVAIRIGGADMPVLISFLNATSGFAAAFCGVTLGSHLLVACGAVVAASGSILTHVMCRAMNRRLRQVFLGFRATTGTAPLPTPSSPTLAAPAAAEAGRSPLEVQAQAVALFRSVRKAIIVPGYGMAVSQAQAEVVELAGWLQRRGVEVSFAIHPVAGRMPGHMNVLLAEADVDYDLLKEMDAINPQFSQCDLALVVGACDVVNPAANTVPDTPISGMPILRVDEAAHVVVCNLDERPGYSGVRNPLYQEAKTLLLLGDAKASLRGLILALEAGDLPKPPG